MLVGAGAAGAQVTVFTGSATESFGCSLAAKHGHATPETIKGCTLAIENEGLTGRDLAGAHVNRGVLYLVSRRYAAAEADFDTAISIDPGMGEAYINRGATEIAQGQWRIGIADIDRGLPLKPEQPEKAYFNRALAREQLEDLKGAYADYKMAIDLAPTWDLPKDELKRFTVANKAAG
jgi:tetratricopeptide (TPR) repeat protein